MNKNKFILSIGTGMLLVNGAFANHTDDNVKPFDISTIEYIEEEMEIDELLDKESPDKKYYFIQSYKTN